jgi:nicotinate-nucleotide pyrophosphorylase (carboxylating)
MKPEAMTLNPTKFKLIQFLLEDLYPESDHFEMLKKVQEKPESDLTYLFPEILDQDITSSKIFDKNQESTFRLIAKEDGVISGIDLASQVFRLLDPSCQIEIGVLNGKKVKSGQLIGRVIGNTLNLLIAERTALNLLTHLSGVATRTREFVDLVKDTETKILDTRKTIPGLRLWQKKAVLDGGGNNHRIGLYDQVLIKNNHIDKAGGVKEAIDKITKNNDKKYFVICEVRDLAELKAALENKVDRILLDNFKLETIQEAIKITENRTPLEVSGNVNKETILDIAKTGVDYISIGGSLTMNAPRLDISFKV